eukprot:SAG31_NODE_43502_length_267_cov_0.559524_1_plen_33_part_01
MRSFVGVRADVDWPDFSGVKIRAKFSNTLPLRM